MIERTVRVLSHRPNSSPASALAWFFLVTTLASAETSTAQVVKGRLLESGSRKPILLGTVALLDTTLAVVDHIFTNETGSFVLNAPRPGAYYVLAERLGYRRSLDGILDLGANGSITVDFYLRPQPLVLDSIVVAAEREMSVQHLRNVGFYQRKEQGYGFFITPERIDATRPFQATELLRGIPGVRAQDGPLGTFVFFRQYPQDCNPALYVDGARMPDSAAIDRVVAVEDIQAVELYTRATVTPLEWGGTQGGCGAMVIWTRK